MEAKLFKNFTPFLLAPGKSVPLTALRDLDARATDDPTGSQWSYIGFAPITEGEEPEYAIDVQGAARLCVVQINERILPGAIVREKMATKIKSIEEREDRKVRKTEYAQIKDEVVQEWLPKSHIRRKLIPVMFMREQMLVFTSSAKVCDDVTMLLCETIRDFAATYGVTSLASVVKNNIEGTLTTVAKEGGTLQYDDPGQPGFFTGDSALIKGPGKQAIRIKDKPVTEAEVLAIIEQEGFSVTQLALNYHENSDEDAAAAFVLNDKLVVSRFIIPNLAGATRSKDAKDAADTFINTAWMTAQTARDVVNEILLSMGGRVTAEAEDDDL